MIRDKFKQWLKESDSVSWQEAKKFYDSHAKGDPKWTSTAVNRLLGEFAQQAEDGSFSAKGRSKDKAAPEQLHLPFDPSGLQVVFETSSKPNHTLHMKEPDKNAFRASNSEVQGWIRDIVKRFEEEPDTARTVDIRIQGASMVVVHKLPPLSPGKRQYRQYRIWVNGVQQEGTLSV